MPKKPRKCKRNLAAPDWTGHSCVVGVDPGNRCGYCVARKGPGGWTVTEVGGLATAAAAVDAILKRVQPDAIIIEGQYIGRNRNSVLSLVRNAQTWACLGELNSVVRAFIQPDTWFATVFGVEATKLHRLGRKQAARAAVDEWGVPVKSQDQADAVCILASVLGGGPLTWATDDRGTSPP